MLGGSAGFAVWKRSNAHQLCRRYTCKVCSLGAFSYYCAGDELTAHGGSALLEKELVRILLPVLPAARAQSYIPRWVSNQRRADCIEKLLLSNKLLEKSWSASCFQCCRRRVRRSDIPRWDPRQSIAKNLILHGGQAARRPAC